MVEPLLEIQRFKEEKKKAYLKKACWREKDGIIFSWRKAQVL